MKKRILLCASYSSIEPLGIMHLGGLARDAGWECSYHLVKRHDFSDFFQVVKDFEPDIVGFNVYTGNHLQLKEAFVRLKREHPGIMTIVGGPHPTYFPTEAIEFSDYVIMSEGFNSLRLILSGEASPGIMSPKILESFPQPDRKGFYKNYPEHRDSPIKSVITMTGCPYTCTYCYNSSEVKDIKMAPDSKFSFGEGFKGRLFPQNIRSVKDVVLEGQQIIENYPTEMVYIIDDVHGMDVKNWLPEFSQEWKEKVSLPYHAQMRWEMTAHSSGEKRLDLLREAGCFGLTLAIEAANPIIREEVLSRAMKDETMFGGMRLLMSKGFKVRTEQITGLPYGATSEPTPVNLEADLELVKLNVELKEKTGGPTMAWASTFAPYKGTKLGAYCERFGHYNGDNSDVPDTFFDRSVLSFPKEWVGESLQPTDQDVWMGQCELERYREQNAELRRIFNFVTLIPQGHILAEKYLKSDEPFSYERLGGEIMDHLFSLTSDEDGMRLVHKLEALEDNIWHRNLNPDMEKDLQNLVAYFAVLPQEELAIDRIIDYTEKDGASRLTPQIFSDGIRHHLYDNVLYKQA